MKTYANARIARHEIQDNWRTIRYVEKYWQGLGRVSPRYVTVFWGAE